MNHANHAENYWLTLQLTLEVCRLFQHLNLSNLSIVEWLFTIVVTQALCTWPLAFECERPLIALKGKGSHLLLVHFLMIDAAVGVTFREMATASYALAAPSGVSHSPKKLSRPANMIRDLQLVLPVLLFRDKLQPWYL